MRPYKRTLFLCLALILSACLLAGCGKSSKKNASPGSEEKTEAPAETETAQAEKGSDKESDKDYSGYYTATYDFAEEFSDDAMELSSLNIIFHLTLTKKKTFKLYTDAAEVRDAIKTGLEDQLTEAQQKKLDQMYSDNPAPEESTSVESTTGNVTLEDASLGDASTEESSSESSSTETVLSSFPVLKEDGKYLVRDNKLILNPDQDDEKECTINPDGSIEMTLTLNDLSKDPVTLIFTKTDK